MSANVKTFDNTYQLDRLLHRSSVPLSLAQIAAALGVAENTAHRAIKYLRDTLDAPIEHRRDHPAGYRYTNKAFELRGIWFSPEEMQSLLLLLTLLEAFDPGLLAAGFAPLKRKLANFLRKLGMTADTRGRIRLLRVAGTPPGPAFEPVATAVLQRRRMSMRYTARGTSAVSFRQISPQRLTHYRDKWYLDAWCHSQNALRTFSVDCIDQTEVHEERALDIAAPKLDRKLGVSYGIFSGSPTATARLRFTPERARWVGPEQWHPDQKSWTEKTGHYVLEIPYSSPYELELDICRYGPDVEVQAPLDLRQSVATRLRAAAAQYA